LPANVKYFYLFSLSSGQVDVLRRIQHKHIVQFIGAVEEEHFKAIVLGKQDTVIRITIFFRQSFKEEIF
jgi:hypothetical protein